MLYFFIAISCKQKKLHLTKIEASKTEITDSLEIDSDIDAFIAPFRNHIEKDLDSVLAYSTNTYSKSMGDFNTAIGNFMADAIYEEANPIFNKRTGKNIDMVILNHGGIRSIISKGDIKTRTAYELMPFENSIVVVALKGSQIDSLTYYLSHNKKAHPVSKLQLTINENFNIVESSINGNIIESNKTYYVATNDFLYNGGDDMNFFKPNDSLYVLNYKVRSALIDHFKRIDTLSPTIDNRFIQIK